MVSKGIEVSFSITKSGEKTMYEDEKLICEDCGAEFVFTAGEQEFYAEKGFNNQPVRCKACRDKRKTERHLEREKIKTEIKKAREIAEGGIIGVNIMVATKRYEDYVRSAVEAGVDIVISGAGLPMNLPELVEGSSTKIAPIVSSRKALDVVTKYWKKKYNRR